MNRRSYFFYFLSFVEGGSVMAAELLGAKMLAPYYGTSLYVWSAVLAVTLGGLAIGYFAGGLFSEKLNKERILYYILLFGSFFLMLMPVFAKIVMVHTAGMDLLTSIIVSSLFFLFPPVFLMGMVSPLIVECIAGLTRRKHSDNGKEVHPGKISGAVYAVSTLGGIVSTFFLGFYCIPEFGLTKPAIVSGIILGIIPFVKLISIRKLASLLFPFIVFFAFNSSKSAAESSAVNILYANEGLLGQIIVADYPIYEGKMYKNDFQRILFVNRSTQTIVTFSEKRKRYFEYVHLISKLLGNPQNGKRALVLGLGGGSVVKMLDEKGITSDVVELDFRIAEVAKKYFDLPRSARVIIDDARHFLAGKDSDANKGEKYDVIILDAFVGEVNPHHLFTQEFFNEIKAVLSDSGTFFINGHGYWNGNAGKGMRSVCKTLLHSGFNVEIMPTEKNEDYRNLVFIAQKCSVSVGKLSATGIGDMNLGGAVLLVDEKPQLELLNAEANRRWREACMRYFLSGYYSKQDRLLFK